MSLAQFSIFSLLLFTDLLKQVHLKLTGLLSDITGCQVTTNEYRPALVHILKQKSAYSVAEKSISSLICVHVWAADCLEVHLGFQTSP